MRQFKPTTERFTLRNRAFDLLSKDLKKVKILKKDELNKLVIQYQETKCPQALDKITKSLLRFMVSVSNSYANVKGSISSITDLTNIAYEGMHEALDKFDASKGFCFSSYAVWWMRQRILYNVQKMDLIQRPYKRTVQGVKEFTQAYIQEHGVEPSDYEISIATGASLVVLDGLKGRKTFSLSYDKNRSGKYDEFTILDSYQDNNYLPDEGMVDSDNKTIVEGLLNQLPETQRMIIRYSFGIGLERVYNLEEIGQMLGRTREVVRLRKNKALKKLAKLAKR